MNSSHDAIYEGKLVWCAEEGSRWDRYGSREPINFKWTIILPEEHIRPIIETTLDHLARYGVKVVVILTGHYPREQVAMVHALAKEAASRNSSTQYIGLSESEITTPLPGDTRRGDHAAKYETSIALALNPEWVRLDSLRAGRDPEQVTTSATPRKPTPTPREGVVDP